MNKSFLNTLQKAREAGRKKLAILIDPDSQHVDELAQTVEWAEQAQVDAYFVGGSLLLRDALDETLLTIKKRSARPTLIFPGSVQQVSAHADGILFLSLISGRNPDLLIGQQVIAAPMVREANLEVIATGYMLIDSGRPTTASYMSHSQPIPHHKPEIAACTALAGQYLGMHTLYLDGGSGAEKPIDTDMITAVRDMTHLPLIVGGGIQSPERAQALCRAGADVIVVGNAFETNPSLMNEMARAVHEVNLSLT